MNFYRAAPDAIKALVAVESQVTASGLEQSLIELVKTRASQINGCAFCVQYHILQGESLGVPIDKLNLVVVWREVPQFSARERAALAWTEALTLVSETHAPDADYEAVRAEFTDGELVNLTTLIGTINAWNRIAIGFRAVHPVKVKVTA